MITSSGRKGKKWRGRRWSSTALYSPSSPASDALKLIITNQKLVKEIITINQCQIVIIQQKYDVRFAMFTMHCVHLSTGHKLLKHSGGTE